MPPMDARFRRQLAVDAIERIKDGSLPKEIEDQYLDFKEEKGTFDPKAKRRVPISRTDEAAARALSEEAACLANSDGGGILVVGVDEKTAGPRAFVGTYLDVEWLRERIYALTLPHLPVDIIETVYVGTNRLYLINVPPALEEIRVGGKLRARLNDDCVELDGNKAREFLERRRHFDWTSEPSGVHVSGAGTDAFASARRHYEAEQGTSPRSNVELARRLGVIVGDDRGDPELSRAGALLLCPFEPAVEHVELVITRAEGAPSTKHLFLKAPLLLSFDEAWGELEPLFEGIPVVIGAQRTRLSRIHERAVREALVNAIMHRDYRMTAPITVRAIGEPASALKVTSPGGLPRGVSENRLISVSSRPRNPTLANAFRVLGLAEREGVGVGEMYTKMLRDGHEPPSIFVDSGDVVVHLRGGQPNLEVRSLMNDLYERDDTFEFDVAGHLAIRHLLSEPTLRASALADLAQTVAAEAAPSLERLQELGVVERLVNRSWTFRLTAASRERLRKSINYPRRRSIDDHAELVRAYLESNSTIGREDAARLIGVSTVQASRILSQLARDSEWLRPVGSGKGRGNSYKLV